MMDRVAYLLDANVVSEMMRPTPEPAVAACLDLHAGQGLGLATITVWEILNGIGKLPSGRRRDGLEGRFRGVVDDYFAERLINWTSDDAEACARIMETKRRRGEPLDDHLPDAVLAGVAVNRGLKIISRNLADFRNTGAEIIDPWTAAFG